MTADTPNRRYELDWLRVLAILLVFLYHSTRFFNMGDWHVKNGDVYVWLKAGGQKVLAGVANLLAVPGTILVCFTIPMVLMKTLVPPAVLEVGNGGWGFLYYLWFLIGGFILVSNKRLIQSVDKQRWLFLILGLVLSVSHLYLLFGVANPALKGESGDWIASLFSYLSAWCWVFAIHGFAIKHLSFERPFLRQANEAVLPFFIMHQTVLLFFGYFIVQWEIHDTLKWLLVFTVSFVVIVAIYVGLIQRFDLLRFVFGMKTSHPFYRIFQKKFALILLPIVWLGLSVYAGVNQKAVLGQERFPIALEYNHRHDIVLNAEHMDSCQSFICSQL